MGKIIQFPGGYEEEVHIPEIVLERKKKRRKVKNNKQVEKIIKSIFSLVCKVKINKKVLVLCLFLLLFLVSTIKINNFVTTSRGTKDAFAEEFNLELTKELNNELGIEDAQASDTELKDISITITPTIEGEDFAIYNTEILISLKAKDIKVKNEEKTFKFSDVDIEIIDVSADLKQEELALLSESSISDIAKETAELTKKLKKELKTKYKDYITELIYSEL